jgi:hypothetical protein
MKGDSIDRLGHKVDDKRNCERSDHGCRGSSRLAGKQGTGASHMVIYVCVYLQALRLRVLSNGLTLGDGRTMR